MLKSNKRIEIVRTSTKGLSLMSRVSCDAILLVLAKHYSDVRVTAVDSLSDLELLALRRPDLVFLGMECIPSSPSVDVVGSNKIWLSEFLDQHDIPHTGSTKIAHKLGRHKALAKQRVLSAGLRTAAFCVIKQNQTFNKSDIPLTFPVFIKPTDRGGGVGIDSDSVAHTFEQLQRKVHSIASEFQADSIIEEYLPGREFSVAILKNEDSEDFHTLPIELIAPPDRDGERLLSSQVKSSDTEQVQEVTDPVLKTSVTGLALKVFYALGGRNYGRIDIRLDTSGIPHFLEVNLIPSLISGYGSFPKACALNIGLEYEPMIMKIVRLGLARKENAVEVEHRPMAMSDFAFPSSKIAFETV